MIRPSLPALACIVTLAALAVAAEAAGRLAVEHHNGVPAQWTRLGATPRETSIALVIALKQQNLDVLEQTLLRVSDPRDAAYGRHLSHMEVQRLVAPQQESVQAVLDWLREHSVDLAHGLAISPNADFVRVVVPVSLAERMLQAEFHHFQHAASGHAVHRLAAPYTLPARLAAHVDFVGPTVRFPRVQRAALRLNALPDAAVTPAMLRQLYNVGAAEGRSPDNLQAVAQFLEQYYSPSDLAAFFARFYQPAVGRNVSRVQGPNTPSQPGMEATLDIQYIMALGGNVSTEFWSFPGRAPDNPENEPFLDWLLAIASDPHPPHVFSVSYGDNEDSVTPQYAARVNAEFQKAGARGVSLLFSSGDGGVGGGQPTRCTAFVPTFPAGSPWVTAVGGTTGSAPEVAASLSSGGFSNYWAAPDFQRSAIATYLAVRRAAAARMTARHRLTPARPSLRTVAVCDRPARHLTLQQLRRRHPGCGGAGGGLRHRVLGLRDGRVRHQRLLAHLCRHCVAAQRSAPAGACRCCAVARSCCCRLRR